MRKSRTKSTRKQNARRESGKFAYGKRYGEQGSPDHATWPKKKGTFVRGEGAYKKDEGEEEQRPDRQGAVLKKQRSQKPAAKKKLTRKCFTSYRCPEVSAKIGQNLGKKELRRTPHTKC